MIFELRIALVALFVCLTLCTAILLYGLMIVDRKVAVLLERSSRRQCGEVVSWGNAEIAQCARLSGHTGDHAVTLASIEKVGYHQPPF